MIRPKILRPTPQAINNDQSLQQNISMSSLNQALYFEWTVKRAKRVLTHDFSRFPQNWQKLLRASVAVFWVPGAFHARFPVFFLSASPVVPSAKGRTRVGLRPTKLLVAQEKKPLVPRLVSQIKSIEKSVKEVTYVCP